MPAIHQESLGSVAVFDHTCPGQNNPQNPWALCTNAAMLLNLAGKQSCFAGDTVVQVRDDTGRAMPTKIKHVKTGQHILCTDTNDDLRLPTEASWCELMNWVSRTE